MLKLAVLAWLHLRWNNKNRSLIFLRVVQRLLHHSFFCCIRHRFCLATCQAIALATSGKASAKQAVIFLIVMLPSVKALAAADAVNRVSDL
jgi:hypothetical protein